MIVDADREEVLLDIGETVARPSEYAQKRQRVKAQCVAGEDLARVAKHQREQPADAYRPVCGNSMVNREVDLPTGVSNRTSKGRT